MSLHRSAMTDEEIARRRWNPVDVPPPAGRGVLVLRASGEWPAQYDPQKGFVTINDAGDVWDDEVIGWRFFGFDRSGLT